MEENKTLKDFNLQQVLSVSSGRPLTDSKHIKPLLDYLNDCELQTEQIPHAIILCNSYILSKYPELNGIGVDEHFVSLEHFQKFIEQQINIHGNQFVFPPMPEFLRVSTTPEEAKDIFPKMLQLAKNAGLSKLVNSFDYGELNKVQDLEGVLEALKSTGYNREQIMNMTHTIHSYTPDDIQSVLNFLDKPSKERLAEIANTTQLINQQQEEEKPGKIHR